LLAVTLRFELLVSAIPADSPTRTFFIVQYVARNGEMG